ncbi:MAG: GNAT family N-acetyltransferase [Ruminococcaceae bacterium]|nr:GNAT family N-acetyltransferase [Oscillospiraceae bacterium]
MKLEPREITCKNGKTLTLRSPEPDDAEAMLDYLRRTAGETHFLTAYPEEQTHTVEWERDFLTEMLADERRVMLTLFDGACPVGSCSFQAISPREKMRHRAGLGIAIIREYWGQGLGRMLLREAAAHAKAAGFVQLELGVYADNERAFALYESEGYRQYGRIPGAFRLRDGSMIDELLMFKPL